MHSDPRRISHFACPWPRISTSIARKDLRNGVLEAHGERGTRHLTTPHGLGYAKIIIVVDADVDPFDLKQVMWAMSVKASGRSSCRVLTGRRSRARNESGRRSTCAVRDVL